MDQKYFKIIPKDRYCGYYTYRDGLNICPGKHFDDNNNNIREDTDEEEYGFYLIKRHSLTEHYHHGYYLAVVELPIDDPEFKMTGTDYANRIIISGMYPLSDITIYEKIGIPYPKLSLCIREGYLDIAKFLIDHSMVDDYTGSINHCIRSKNMDMFQYIFCHADCPKYNKADVLEVACAIRNLEIVKFLIGDGGDINIHPAMFMCVSCGYLDLIQLLIPVGSLTQQSYDYYFGMACKNGKLDAAKYFVQLGANISTDESIFYTTVRLGHLEIVKYLLQMGANIDMERAILVSSKGHLHVFEYLVQCGANYRIQNDEPFLNACCSNNFDIVEYLISLGVDVNIHDGIAIKSAVEFGKRSMVESLVSLGADLRIDNDYCVKKVLEYGDSELMKYFVNLYENIGVDIVSILDDGIGKEEIRKQIELLCKNDDDNDGN